jgi:glycosyltransferase involved in cell wall biosynthesis
VNRSNPTISVLLLVFNSKRHLPQSLQSTLGQTFHDLEIVAIDDGSDDGSDQFLRLASRPDRRLRVVVREHRGLVETLAECADLVRGEFLARIDADDVCEPQRFARQLAVL